MGTPYVSEIRMFAGSFAPVGWAFCDGTVLAIAENEALFELIGTTYGGDGVNTFALPNLVSRMPLGQGNGYTLGQQAGEQTVTLTSAQLPVHRHSVAASDNAATSTSPAGNVWSASSQPQYTTAGSNVAMDPNSIAAVGQGQPHENRPPYLGLNFIISLYGIFPTQN